MDDLAAVACRNDMNGGNDIISFSPAHLLLSLSKAPQTRKSNYFSSQHTGLSPQLASSSLGSSNDFDGERSSSLAIPISQSLPRDFPSFMGPSSLMVLSRTESQDPSNPFCGPESPGLHASSWPGSGMIPMNTSDESPSGSPAPSPTMRSRKDSAGIKRRASESNPTSPSPRSMNMVRAEPKEAGENEIVIIHEINQERIIFQVPDFNQKVIKIRQELVKRGYTDGRLFFGKDLANDKSLFYYGIKSRDKLFLKENSQFSRFHEKFFHWDKARFGRRKQQGSTPLKSNSIISELSNLLDDAKMNQGSIFISEYSPLPVKRLCQECARKSERCKLRTCENCGMSEFYIVSYPSSPETRKQILEVFIPSSFRLFHLLSANYLRWLALGRKTITYLENLSIGATGKIAGKGNRRIICFSLRYKCPRQAKGYDDTSEDVCFNIFAEFDFGKYLDYLAVGERPEKKKQTNEEQAMSIRRILEAIDSADPNSGSSSSMTDVNESPNFWANDIWNLVITDDTRRLNVKETLRILFYDFCSTCSLDPQSYCLVVRIPKDDEPSDLSLGRPSKKRKVASPLVRAGGLEE
eukprot:CAMPEP_0201522994 /NCGR_PEP_ID=MMETSP0161_2-20130828/18681_1 /ASSEMBLY_ACC=CAM_ASM_000251 /TAXON_ID=180227 /ORGANISM="Neoparamoeba aestuarina, Strain SoJaBio B1-5/56/2" /LENGTH=579 /DNA_ID=CAMNT_0047921983 /DNA_START=126 /DNA_END=1865 /DNA_ORIENTATION=-